MSVSSTPCYSGGFVGVSPVYRNRVGRSKPKVSFKTQDGDSVEISQDGYALLADADNGTPFPGSRGRRRRRRRKALAAKPGL